VNWLPLSDVMMAGFLNRAIQLLMRASTQVSVSMEGMGMASSQRLVLSMMVNRYLKPSLEVVRGPKKSTWMWAPAGRSPWPCCTPDNP
jgi:hypothetical protein